MRLLVDGRGLAAAGRMHHAALGLARRGHEVWWHPARGDATDPLVAAGAQIAPAGMALSRLRVQAVIGAGRPAAPVRLGWIAGAHVLVHEVAAADLGRWSLLDRWAWDSLQSFALVEESEAGDVQRAPGPLSLGRVGLWSSEPSPPAVAAGHVDVEILERALERSLARLRGNAPRRAVFLDRDGTLITERGYLADPDGVQLLPGVAGALRRLQGAGYALVVISNQAGVGRGYFPIERVHEVMARMRSLLRREGVELDAIYFCPHAPDEGCACRKPGTELIERAEDDLVLDARGSVMVGDKRLDVETGRRAGMPAVLVRTGYGGEEAGSAGEADGTTPDGECTDLEAAASWIIDLHHAHP